MRFPIHVIAFHATLMELIQMIQNILGKGKSVRKVPFSLNSCKIL